MISKRQKAFAGMYGKTTVTRYMLLRILTRVRKYTQKEKKQLSVALQNPKSCMDCVIAVCAEKKEFWSNAYLRQQYRI